MKEDLIHFILEKSDRRRRKLMNAIIDEIKRRLLPIRKGRHYPRTDGVLAGKYSNSRKKAIRPLTMKSSQRDFYLLCPKAVTAQVECIQIMRYTKKENTIALEHD
jgi:hypothetical protein